MKTFSLILLLYPIIAKIPEYEIFMRFPQLNLTIAQQKQEYIFYNEGTFTTIIFLFGCFILLFGGYYYFFLIIELTLFLYYIISIFIKYDEGQSTEGNVETEFRRNLLFVLVFSFISGVLLYIGYKSFINFFKKYYYIKRIIFGAITGCFLSQIIFHYIYTFKTDYEQNIYYILFPVFIVILGVGHIFIPESIELIPCSVVSGAFFIKASLDNLLGYSEKKAENIALLILFIIFIIAAFFYQLYHLKRKKNELPSSVKEAQTTIRQNLDITVTDDPQSVNNANSTEMLDKTNNDGEKANEEIDVTQDNNVIDDHDD